MVVDYSVLKRVDRPYVNCVVEYLEPLGLGSELAGSALRRNYRYNDIDILATGTLEQITDAVSGLMGYDGRVTPFQRIGPNGTPITVTSSDEGRMYMNTFVDHRVKITPEGHTPIDLCLKIQQ
jgi:hypothetical protein